MLDLGAGTGKLTALLVRRYADVTAVEPLRLLALLHAGSYSLPVEARVYRTRIGA